MKLTLLVLGSLLFSGFAFGETRRFECTFTDSILRYTDVITLQEGGVARVESSVSSASESNEGSFACVAEAITYREQEGRVRLAGQSRCADGSEGAFEKTLDLTRLELSGGWQGSVPCRAAP